MIWFAESTASLAIVPLHKAIAGLEDLAVLVREVELCLVVRLPVPLRHPLAAAPRLVRVVVPVVALPGGEERFRLCLQLRFRCADLLQPLLLVLHPLGQFVSAPLAVLA